MGMGLFMIGFEIWGCLCDEEQAQELAMNAARCRHAGRQKGHCAVPCVWAAAIGDRGGASSGSVPERRGRALRLSDIDRRRRCSRRT